MEDEIADKLEGVDLRQGKGKGKGRGGGGGGSGSRQVTLSRALSRLLRHQAQNAGIQLDKEGFAPLDRVLRWGPLRSLEPTFQEIKDLVRDNDKQRFTLKPKSGAAADGVEDDEDDEDDDPAHWLIRANQGHSIKLDSEALLKPIALPNDAAQGQISSSGSGPGAETADVAVGAVPAPPTVVHGTYLAHWPSIVSSGGLRPMGRNHVHCSTGVPDDSSDGGAAAAVVSGMRRDAELLVYVDVARSIREAGMRWWLSDNGVVLTEGDGEDGVVPLRFFSLVVGRGPQGGSVGVLWKDGEKVADLPEGIKGRLPRGKEERGGRRGGGRGRGGK